MLKNGNYRGRKEDNDWNIFKYSSERSRDTELGKNRILKLLKITFVKNNSFNKNFGSDES